MSRGWKLPNLAANNPDAAPGVDNDYTKAYIERQFKGRLLKQGKAAWMQNN